MLLDQSSRELFLCRKRHITARIELSMTAATHDARSMLLKTTYAVESARSSTFAGAMKNWSLFLAAPLRPLRRRSRSYSGCAEDHDMGANRDVRDDID